MPGVYFGVPAGEVVPQDDTPMGHETSIDSETEPEVEEVVDDEVVEVVEVVDLVEVVEVVLELVVLEVVAEVVVVVVEDGEVERMKFG